MTGYPARNDGGVDGHPAGVRPPSSDVTQRALSVVATHTSMFRQETEPSSLVVSDVTCGQEPPASLVPRSASVEAAPAAQQFCVLAHETDLVVAHDTARIYKLVGMTWPVQVRPAFLVTRAAWPTMLPSTRFFVSGTMATQNFVPGKHDTGDTAVPMEYLAGSVLMIQSLPDKAA